MQTKNQHERAARLTKALALIAAIDGFAARHGLDPVQVATYADAADWEMFAKLARVNLPSGETRTMVVAALRQAHEISASAGA